MDHVLRLHARADRLFKIPVRSEVVPFSLEPDIHPVTPVLQPEYAAEPAAVVSAVLPLLQDLDACAVHPVEFVRQLLLVLPLQAAAAHTVSLDEHIF